MSKKGIQFIDLQAQQKKIRPLINDAVLKVLDHGHYIMGPEVYDLEKALSDFCGAKHVLSCANGTDALGLYLMAKNVGAGEAVFVPTFTFAATAEVVSWMGATPIFVDVLEDTFNMDPKSLEKGIDVAKRMGLKLSGIIPVDLFGLPADYDQIQSIADEYDMWVLADGAQSFGATYKGKKVGTLGSTTTTSFFPAKPLGCYGDGGAVFTDDTNSYTVFKSLRVHGQGTDKYDNIRIGMNARLDTMQAAILIEKLRIFPDEIKARNYIASIYTEALKPYAKTPYVPQDVTSVWAQYTLDLEGRNRAKIMHFLKEAGIPTMIYYVKPLHLQTAYSHYPRAENSLRVSERLANDVMSLPMHPYLSNDEQSYIIEKLITVLGQ